MTFKQRLQKERWWIFIFVGAIAYTVFRGIAGHPQVVLATVLLGLMTVNDMYDDRWFAKWTGLALRVALLALSIAVGLGWVKVGILAFFLLGSSLSDFINSSQRADQSDKDDSSDDRPMRSIVLLLRESHFLDAAVIARLAGEAWQTEVKTSSQQEDADDDTPLKDMPAMVVGDHPPFMCMYPPHIFVIHSMDSPYFDDVDSVISELREVRLQKAVAEHTAWISCDLINTADENNEQALLDADQKAARFLAKLIDDNCLAVVDLLNGRIYPNDPEMEDKLLRDDPREALRDWYFVPVTGIDGNDTEMEQAVAEATERWPEFVSAFERRDPDAGDSYSIKARFQEGDVAEFIWVAVTAIEGDAIYGTLGNEPVNLTRLKIEDRVRVPLADLNDWLVIKAGKMTGGFTIPILMKRSQGQ